MRSHKLLQVAAGQQLVGDQTCVDGPGAQGRVWRWGIRGGGRGAELEQAVERRLRQAAVWPQGWAVEAAPLMTPRSQKASSGCRGRFWHMDSVPIGELRGRLPLTVSSWQRDFGVRELFNVTEDTSIHPGSFIACLRWTCARLSGWRGTAQLKTRAATSYFQLPQQVCITHHHPTLASKHPQPHGITTCAGTLGDAGLLQCKQLCKDP